MEPLKVCVKKAFARNAAIPGPACATEILIFKAIIIKFHDFHCRKFNYVDQFVKELKNSRFSYFDQARSSQSEQNRQAKTLHRFKQLIKNSQITYKQLIQNLQTSYEHLTSHLQATLRAEILRALRGPCFESYCSSESCYTDNFHFHMNQ